MVKDTKARSRSLENNDDSLLIILIRRDPNVRTRFFPLSTPRKMSWIAVITGPCPTFMLNTPTFRLFFPTYDLTRMIRRFIIVEETVKMCVL